MKKRVRLLLLFAIAVCYTGKTQPKGNSDHAPSNALWTKVLKRYVNQSGLVNYKGLLKDRGEFNQYLNLLSSNPPSDKWSCLSSKLFSH